MINKKSLVFPDISAPTTMQVEITSSCNYKCRHCYNFWRHEDSPQQIMSMEKADNLIDQIIENKVFHVILSGGECMTNYPVLLHFVKRLSDAGVSCSINTNVFFATKERMKELADAGLPHLLTTLNSYIPEINDKMVSYNGAYEKIIQGIKYSVDAGIRVSANMITTQLNKHHVFNTGKLLSELGVTNFFTTRMVPSKNADSSLEQELQLNHGEEKELVLNEAIRVKEATGINIGSLIQYPVCYLKDVEKYIDYVGRGCPAGRKMICINANGDTHACLHENNSYGNVFTDGLEKCWQSMDMWRDDSLLPKKCKDCSWINYCEGACRVYTNDLKDMDLIAGDNSDLPNVDILKKEFIKIAENEKFYVPKRLRFRKENGFYLVSARGASIFEVDNNNAEFLIEYQKSGKEFGMKDFSGDLNDLTTLIECWIVESKENRKIGEPVSTKISSIK